MIDQKQYDLDLKFMETYDSIGTSYHEAGHIVFGLISLMYINKARLEKDENRISGFTYYSFIEPEHISDQDVIKFVLEAEICMKYSGLIAEKCYYKDISGSSKFPNVLKNGCESDTNGASKIFQKYNLSTPGKKRSVYKKKLKRRTHRLIKKHWLSVAIIAKALFKSKQLSYNKIKKILLKNTEVCKFWKQHFKKIDDIYKNYSTIDMSLVKTYIESVEGM